MKPEKLHSGRGEIEWVSKKWHEQQIAEKDKRWNTLKERVDNYINTLGLIHDQRIVEEVLTIIKELETCQRK